MWSSCCRKLIYYQEEDTAHGSRRQEKIKIKKKHLMINQSNMCHQNMWLAIMFTVRPTGKPYPWTCQRKRPGPGDRKLQLTSRSTGTVVEGMCGMLLGLNLKIHTAYSFPSLHFFVAYVFAFTIWIVRRLCATRIAKSHIEIRFRSKPRANKDVRMAEAPEVDWCTHKHVGVWTAVWCLSLCGVNSIL